MMIIIITIVISLIVQNRCFVSRVLFPSIIHVSAKEFCQNQSLFRIDTFFKNFHKIICKGVLKYVYRRHANILIRPALSAFRDNDN